MSQQQRALACTHATDRLPLLNRQLADALAEYPYQTAEILEAARYSVSTPGHRWRPILLLTIYEHLSGLEDVSAALPVACAVEFLHTSSIILDDLPVMDDATLRRGKEPCHIRFGQATAILTACWLCDVAQHLIHTAPTSDAARVAHLEEFFRATKNEMLRGQSLDLCGRDLTDDEIIEKCRLKSGALYAFTASAPAYMLGLGTLADSLKKFGNYLGIAYQLADDVNDQIGRIEDVGKDVGKDEGKDTIPNRRGLQKTREMIALYKGMCLDEIRRTPLPVDTFAPLVDLICM